uniref:Ig-like domain-containing protein n=1 Tax=Astyanax mexicanus TaxID=7994 RepID=A0A3B1JZI7_ASTMX
MCVFVFVLEPPSILGESSVQVEPVEGSVVTLECEVSGTPSPQISWLRDGRPLLLTTRIHLLPTHSALRSVTHRVLSNMSFVWVPFPPAPPTVDRTEPTEQLSVVLGSVVTLTCEAHGVPPPTLTWLKDGRPLHFSHNQLPDGQETRFQLPAVGRSDAGLYSCVASNPAGSSTKTFNLTVLGTLLHKLMSSGSLIITSATQEDEGYFECTVTNDVGEERRIIEVILQGKEKTRGLKVPEVNMQNLEHHYFHSETGSVLPELKPVKHVYVLKVITHRI